MDVVNQLGRVICVVMLEDAVSRTSRARLSSGAWVSEYFGDWR